MKVSDIESLNVNYKLKFLRACRNLKPKIFIESDFFTYLNDEFEIFILFQDEWNGKYQVNSIEVNESRFNAIKTICRHFFNEDEFLLIKCPKGQ